MNPYRIRAKLVGSKWITVGVTDHWEQQWMFAVSTSGAKLYVNASPEVVDDAFYKLCSLLEEADFDIPSDETKVLVIDGELFEPRAWGVPRGIQVCHFHISWRFGVPGTS